MKLASDLTIPFVWKERKPTILEKFLYIPSHYENHEGFFIDWDRPDIFEKKQQLIVEFCSGNGQWIADMAMKNPQYNWIAVEKDFERARKIWLKIFRMNLPNLFVVFGDGLTFSQYYLPRESVFEVYVNFPDPWPKRRHAKHRIINELFVCALSRILKPGSIATIVTDDAAYSDWIIEHFSSWKSAFGSQNFTTEWPEFGDSFFHSLWIKQNRSIRFHRYINEKNRGRGI